MKKITSESLSNRLVKYGAFSAAILGAANSSGQIVYTDIADETVDAMNARVAVDIDQDGTGDYLFGVGTGSAGFAFIFPASASTATSYNSNAMVGFSGGGYFYPSNLNSGDPINGTNGIFSSARGDFNYDSCAYPGSQFCDGMDGYVGLHFKIGANTHYGWIRIQVAADATNIIIKDFAYNSVAGDPITAGQTLGIQESTINNVRIVSLDKKVSLYNLPESTNFNLISVSGQSVLTGKTTGNTYVIEANTIATGVYVLELNDAATNTVIRKKITL